LVLFSKKEHLPSLEYAFLSPIEIAARTAEIIAPYLALEGPAMPMLHAVQAAFGFVPEASVPVVANALNLSRAEVHGLVSFYHDFRHEPAGRTVLKLCRAEACQACGSDRIAAHASAALGIGWHETTPDGAVTLEPVFCLGLCAAGPCGMVNERTVARINIARLDAILEAAR
jgi:formate dehydrogenase subunit gamma